MPTASESTATIVKPAVQKASRAVPNVLEERLAEARAAQVAALLAHALDVPEAPPRLTRGRLGRHARREVLLRAPLEVEAQLLVDLTIDLSSSKKGKEPHAGLTTS